MKHFQGKRFAAAALGVTMLASAVPLPPVSAALTEEDNFARLLQHSIYFYDANMCGTEVKENTRYAWRGNCHTYDAQVPLKPMGSDNVGTNLSQELIDKYKDILDPDGDGCVDVSGGMHDAGDHVEFGMPENYAASTLGWGYYEFRDAYVQTGQDDHIETVLRHFNDYLMKCTFLDSDGNMVAHCYQVGDGDIDHAFWQAPEIDAMARPAFFLTAEKPQTDYVASAAASLAVNYLNFKDTDPEYARKSLDYAISMFEFARTNPKELSDNKDGPKGYYISSKWEDDYCWAAAWLYKITGDESYLEEIYPYYDYYAAPSYVYCWNDVWNGVQCVLGEISMDAPAKEGEHVYPGFIDAYKEAAGKSPYEEMDCWASVAKAVDTYMAGGIGTITPEGYFWLNKWGSARYNTAAQLSALVYDKYNGGKPSKYSEWAKEQMEYLMGDNKLGRCYVVGFNENSAKHPHHRASSGLSKCEDLADHRHVLYGALVGGPDDIDEHKDITADYIYNEVTIDYNAAFVGAAAGLYTFYGSPDDRIDADFPPEEEGGELGGNDFYVKAYGVDDPKSDGCGVTKLTVFVETTSIEPKKDISIRYFFNISEMEDKANISNVKGNETYDQAMMEANFDGVISAPIQYNAAFDPDIYYVEVTWDGYTICNSNKKYQFDLGLYYGDKWDPSNDWSYQDLVICPDTNHDGSEMRNDKICVYSGGVLVGGEEPDGTVPEIPETPTDTPTDDPVTEPDWGNTDGIDGVDIGDVIFLCKATMGAAALTESGARNADVDQNGIIDTTDASYILQSLIGLVTLPVKA